MNSLFGMMASEPFFRKADRTIPEVAFAIFQAFDEGEYFHPKDSADENLEEKYTKPLLKNVLASIPTS